MIADAEDGSPLLTFSAEEKYRLRSDFPYFCERLLKINPKIRELVKAREDGEDEPTGPLIPFIWNEAQREVWRVMCEQIERGLPMDFVILKARQVGISTLFCAYVFWMMWRQMHTRAAIVAFEKKTTLAELQMTIATFYDALPEGYRPQLRQPGKAAKVGLGDTYFADRKGRCRYVVQKEGAGRGIAADIVLCTEVSFYKNPELFFGGFVPAMGSGSMSLLVKESSAEDGYFRDDYLAAKADGTYRRAIFIPWWMVTDLYFRKITMRGERMFDAQSMQRIRFGPEVRKRQRQLSAHAKKIGRPPVTDEQMWWWMHYCDTKFAGDIEWMQQEFPDDDVTAFQKNSRSAFKMQLPIVADTVAEVAELFPDPPGAGHLRSDTYRDSDAEEQRVWFEPEKRRGYIDQERHAGFFILEAPKDDFTYVLGADVADAEGEDDETGERAFSTAKIYCCETREEVAWWRGNIDPTDWGDEIVKMGYFYNTAMLIVERNNMGRLTEHRIRTLNYPQYRRFKWPDWNVGPHALTKKEMWETNTATKMLMIGQLRQWIKEGLYVVRDPGMLLELSHYTVTKGKFRSDIHSDRIIAGALCIQAVEQTGFEHKSKVLGGSAVRDRSSVGAAERILRASKFKPVPASDELPDNFGEVGSLSKIVDIWEAIGL